MKEEILSPSIQCLGDKMLLPPNLHQRQLEEEKRRREQRLQMAMKNQPNTSSSVSTQNLTYQKRHMNSMVDALKEVRKSKETIKDNHYLRPDNHKGFY